ncbi:MAG: hypothetical protein IJ774_05490 [Selenomonadaceae bacterium]|nr:hypothetical protein [Selenomonadaceae bacterium]MBR1805828.1 hypothetical protein [Selenomonadaceae bacterium]
MFTITTRGLDDAISKLKNADAGKLQRALRSAVLRTLRGAKKEAGTRVKQRYTANAGLVTRTIQIKAAGLSGSMTSSGGKNPLPKFIVRPRSRPRIMPAGGVFAMNVRGQGGQITHAFLQKSGNVYERTGASRFPIRHLKGPSAPGMLSNPHVAPFIVRKMEQRIGIEIEHAAAALGFF